MSTKKRRVSISETSKLANERYKKKAGQIRKSVILVLEDHGPISDETLSGYDEFASGLRLASGPGS